MGNKGNMLKPYMVGMKPFGMWLRVVCHTRNMVQEPTTLISDIVATFPLVVEEVLVADRYVSD